MNELTEPWRQHMQAIAKVLNAVKQVNWDRCIDSGGGVLRLYGWVERDDEHHDFVLLDVQRYSDVPTIDYTFATSCPDPELGAEMAKAIGIAMADHTPCLRVEEVFGGLVDNAIKLNTESEPNA